MATIGDVSGAGNIFEDGEINEAYKITDLVALHCKMVRLSVSPSGNYFVSGVPSPSQLDGVVVALLQAGIQPYFSFVFTDTLDSSLVGIPERNYADWFNIGAAFAGRFRANSSFLTGQGITGIGACGYSAINEPDHASGEVLPSPPTTFGLTYTQYHNMLEGLADGVHSVEPAGKVWPAGYLSGNRDQEFTGHGYCAAVADLINEGTLEGIDLHTYHSMTGAKIHDTWGRSHQADADDFIAACGITRPNISIICTETNIRGDPDATTQGYTQTTARNWFLTSMFDVWGTLRPDGQLSAGGPRFPWQLWMQGDPVWYMSSQNSPRIEHWCGHTFKLLMDLLWNMSIVSSTPRTTGIVKLTGGNKTAWAFQNIHSSWTSLSGSTFTINDIPAGTTQVQVYDGNGLIQTVSTPTLQVPSHNFSTPIGKSYLFVANAAAVDANNMLILDNILLLSTVPTVGDLLLLSSATSENIVAQTTTTARTLTGLAPTATATNPSLVSSGVLTTTRFAPTLSITNQLPVATKAMAITGIAPVFTGTTAFAGIPATGAMNFTPRQPTIAAGALAASLVSVRTITKNAPTFSSTAGPVAQNAALFMTGRIPTVSTSRIHAANVGVLSFTRHAPTVFAGADFQLDIDYDVLGSVEGTVIIAGSSNVAVMAVTGTANQTYGIQGGTIVLPYAVRGTMTAESLP